MPRLASKTSREVPQIYILLGSLVFLLKNIPFQSFWCQKSSLCISTSMPFSLSPPLSTSYPHKHKALAFTSYSYFFYISLTDPGLCTASPMCHYLECTKTLWPHTWKTYLGAMESWGLNRGFLSQETITPLSTSIPGCLPSCVRNI